MNVILSKLAKTNKHIILLAAIFYVINLAAISEDFLNRKIMSDQLELSLNDKTAEMEEFSRSALKKNVTESNRGQLNRRALHIQTNKKCIAFELVIVLGGIWAYDHYWVDYDWADIGFNSIKANFEHGFEWDTGKFSMNQILHPYSGNIYFNIARSNGYDYVNSIPYVFCGSMGWELFMENHYPSINDMITTTISGSILGETFYRLADRCLDDEATGINRLGREVLSTLISPMYSINRHLDKDRYGLGNRLAKAPLDFALSLGGQYRDPEDYEDVSSAGVAVALHVEYGEEFSDDIDAPYEYFNLFTAIEAPHGDETGALFINGNLLNSDVQRCGNHELSHGLYQQFAYLNNSLFKLSASSVGYGLKNRFNLGKKSHLIYRNFFYGIILGGSNSSYPKLAGIDLEYNLGPGVSYQTGLELSTGSGIEIAAQFMGYWFKSIHGAEGEELVSYANAGLKVPIYGMLHYSVSYINYNRFGDYREFPDEKRHEEAFRSSVVLMF